MASGSPSKDLCMDLGNINDDLWQKNLTNIMREWGERGRRKDQEMERDGERWREGERKKEERERER